MIEEEHPSVLVRVWLLGPFRVERKRADETWETIEKTSWEHTYARALLKRLLCTRERRAMRSDLMDDLWPERSMLLAEKYLNNAASRLYRVLEHDRLFRSIGTQGRNGYELADQSHIWTDMDACEALLHEAERLGRTSAAALALLERASKHFERGSMLEDEGGQWCIAVRTEKEAMMRCCCLWLAEAYEAHGMLWHARTQYRRLLEINPFDEDILCRLMATLYRHGLLSDALSYYQEAKHRFTREGLSLSHATKQLAEKLTNDPLSPELYLSFQLQSSQSHRSEQVLLRPSLPNARLLHLSIGDLSDAGRQALFLAGLQERWTVGEMNSMLDRILKEYSDMTWKEQKEKAVSRRDVLMLLTGMSSSLLGLTRVGDTSPFLAEEILSLCLTAIPACWNLVYADGIPHVEQVLPQYLMHLTDIAQRSSRCQKQAASLASQGHKLANLLALRREDFLAALKHSKDAWIYGQLAEDLNLQLAALIEEALTFWYRKRPLQTLTTYQKALQLIPREDQASGRHNSISPIIAGRVYAGLAEAYAQLGQEQEALQYMGLAQDTFPEYPENDPHFAYTYYDHYYLYLYQGLMYMKLNQPNQALSTYAYFNAPKYSSRRVEILNREAAALLASDDMHQCCTKVEAAVALAISAKSDLRYSEAYEVHQRMLIKWPHERKVKSLAQIFQLEDRHG